MRMKEVIEKTGLTDRAVRLYIDEGLAAPNIEESYSGRKSIDFSPADVERLINVALLRKAGFSIADIKSIVDDNSTAKKIVENFIEQTENNIAHETQIVKKLKEISFDEDVTIETICDSLSATVEEKEVPKEDMHILLWAKIEKNTYKALGVFSLLFTVVIYILTAFYWMNEYVHLKLTEGWFGCMAFLYAGWITIDLLSVLLIIFNRDKYVKRNKKWCRILSGTIAVLMVFIGYSSLIPTIVGGIAPPAYSFTTDVENYMVLDNWVENSYGDKIYTLFPDEIPSSALKLSDDRYDKGAPFTTRYYYRHTYDFDQFVDIVAEWALPAEEFEKAKAEAFGRKKYKEQKGDWVCVYYSGEPDDWSDIYMFAYNDKTQKVRYIASICIGANNTPYYLSLDW